MLQFDAWQFPDGETHLPKRMQKGPIRIEGRLTYQYPLYQMGLRHCRGRDVAVDVGAHVGLFSYWMVRDFATVVAFEPVEAHRACWEANVPCRPSDVLHACALGAHAGQVSLAMRQPHSSGSTAITGPGPIPLRRLDEFTFTALDLLKIDCEGFELDVVRGAEATLRRHQPTIIVEQRPQIVAAAGRAPTGAVQWLTTLGARIAWTDHRDYVAVWG